MPRTYDQWRDLLRGERLPTVVVDLDAVDANCDLLLRRLGDGPVTLRPASKSVRHPWLLRYLLDRGGDRFAGLMTFSAHEVAFLADQGFDDFLMGYPCARPDEAAVFAALAERGVTAYATVDSVEQLPLLAAAAAERGVTIPLCLDIDVSWRPLGGRVHFGVRRSPVRSVADARAVARRVADLPGLELRALLAYEAQIAGLPDRSRFARHLDPIKRAIKRRSKPLAAGRRAEIRAALEADGHPIAVVNGGGTGSIGFTSSDPSVTEVTAGSGFVTSHLFDGYDALDLQPAAFIALSIVRRSDPDHVTAAGGGYIASGPPALDRQPLVHAPPGLSPLPMEGFGEVQTPFKVGSDAPRLALGDPVLCRHAKAGELAERFREYVFVRGGQIVGREPTYRGLGGCFM